MLFTEQLMREGVMVVAYCPELDVSSCGHTVEEARSNLQTALPLWGIVWLIVGGIAYTTGVIFYTLDGMNKLRHAHGIWHIFVLAGSVSHFISIIAYVR